MRRIELLLLLILAGNALAQNYQFYNKQLTDAQKDQAIYLEKNLMATCCFGGPIYMHGKNQKTEEERITIRRLLVEGKTTDQILDYFRESIDPRTGQPYGNRILASPKASETVGRISYWMVIGFAAIGLILLILTIKKLLTHKETALPEEAVSEETLKKIEAELSELS